MTTPDEPRPLRRRRRALRRGAAPYGRPAVLFVCTANRCRSPLAAALAARAFPNEAAEFASAGLLAGGHPVPDVGIAVARDFGVDLRTHVSRQITAQTVTSADLILAMTRDQARELVAERPELWPRVFTVKQFARWVSAHRPPAPGLTRAWLAEAAAERSPQELLGADPSDDIADPMDRPAQSWRSMTGELLGAIDAMTAALVTDAVTAPIL